MQTQAVISWFNGNQSAVARALGVGKAAVSKWKKTGRIPPLHAARIERLTGGALKFDPNQYLISRSKDRSAA
jgi:transcriptional repressor of cell division inhibition gene dicB